MSQISLGVSGLRYEVSGLAFYIQLITGRGEKYSRGLMNKIRKKLNKRGDQLISIDDFCTFTGLSKEEVEKRLY